MRKLGNYVNLEEVGRGASATVYRGYHPGLKVYRALKVFHRHSPGQERRAREAVCQARVEHPGIVRVLDFERQGELCWLVMEYAPLGTLRQRLDEGPLPLPEALDLAAQAARALAAAHAQGVLHLDLKPENLLFFAPDQIKIGDFGLARPEREPGGDKAAGTPGYMAPEQREGRPCAASDLWALGVVLLEMISGRRPGPNHDPAAVLAGRAGDLEQELAGLLARLLEPRVGSRLRDADALAAELEELARRAEGKRRGMEELTRELGGSCRRCGAPVAAGREVCPACRLEERDEPRLDVPPPLLLEPSPRGGGLPWRTGAWLAPLIGLVLASVLALALGGAPKTAPPRAVPAVDTRPPATAPPAPPSGPPPASLPPVRERPPQVGTPSPGPLVSSARTAQETRRGTGTGHSPGGSPAALEMLRTQREILRRNPEHLGAHRNLALWYLQNGDYDRARRHLETILRRHPHDLEAKNALEMIARMRSGGPRP